MSERVFERGLVAVVSDRSSHRCFAGEKWKVIIMLLRVGVGGGG